MLNYKKPHVRGPRNYFSSWAKQGHGTQKNLLAGGPRWERPGACSSRPVSQVCQAGACKPCNQQGGEFSSGQERKDWAQSWSWGPHKTSRFLVLLSFPHLWSSYGNLGPPRCCHWEAAAREMAPVASGTSGIQQISMMGLGRWEWWAALC